MYTVVVMYNMETGQLLVNGGDVPLSVMAILLRQGAEIIEGQIMQAAVNKYKQDHGIMEVKPVEMPTDDGRA